MKKVLFLAMLAIAAACGQRSEDRARRLIPTRDSAVKCVSESTVGRSADRVEVSFCTDGKTLAICTNDDGCITVNLPAEAAP